MRKNITNLNNTDDVSNFPFIIMIAALSVFGLSYFDKSIPWWLPIPPFVIAAFFYLKQQNDKHLIKTLEKQNPTYVFNLVDSEHTNTQINDNPVIAYVLDNDVDIFVTKFVTDHFFYNRFEAARETIDDNIEVPAYLMDGQFYVLRADILNAMDNTIKKYQKAVRDAKNRND